MVDQVLFQNILDDNCVLSSCHKTIRPTLYIKYKSENLRSSLNKFLKKLGCTF